MSRSYKRPYVTDQNRGKPKRGTDKRIAARAVRNADEVGNGASYRRISNPWDIRDWSIYDQFPKARRK
jgi:hypothetical protein